MDSNYFYFAQPQLIRTRHRFRGHKESYKFNLELGQLRFDIIRLIEKYHNLQEEESTQSSNLYEGTTLTGTKFIDTELATPVLSNVLLEGIDSLSARLSSIGVRLQTLENN